MGTEETIKIVAQVETRFDPSNIIGLRQQIAGTKQQFSGMKYRELEQQLSEAGALTQPYIHPMKEEYLRRYSTGRGETGRFERAPSWQASEMYPGYGYYRGELQSAERLAREFRWHQSQSEETRAFLGTKYHAKYATASAQKIYGEIERQLGTESSIAGRVKAEERQYSKQAEEAAEQKAERDAKYKEENVEITRKIREVLRKNLGLNEKIISQLEKQLKDLEAQNTENVATAIRENRPRDAQRAIQDYFEDSATIRAQIDELKSFRKGGIFSSGLQHHVAEQLLHGNVRGAGSSALYGLAGGAASRFLPFLTNPYTIGAMAIAGAPFAIGGAARYAARKAEPADEFIRGFGNTERLVGSNMSLFDHYRGNDFGLQDPTRWGRLTPQERQKMIRMFAAQGMFGGETATAGSLLPAIERIAGFSRTRGFEQEQGMPLFTSQMRLLGPEFRGSRENNVVPFIEKSTKELNKYFDQSLKYQVSSEEALQSILGLQESFASKGIVLDEKSVFDLSRVLGTLNASGLPMLQGAQGASAIQGLLDPGMGMMPFAVRWISGLEQGKREDLIRRMQGLKSGAALSPELLEQYGNSAAGTLNLAKAILGEGGFPSTGDAGDFLRSLPPGLLKSPAGKYIISQMSPAMRLRLQGAAAQLGGDLSTLLNAGEFEPGKGGADVTSEITRRKETLTASEAANQLATALIAATRAVDDFRMGVSGTGRGIKGGISNFLGYGGNPLSLFSPTTTPQLPSSMSGSMTLKEATLAAIKQLESGGYAEGAVPDNQGHYGPYQISGRNITTFKNRGIIRPGEDIRSSNVGYRVAGELYNEAHAKFGNDPEKLLAQHLVGVPALEEALRLSAGTSNSWKYVLQDREAARAKAEGREPSDPLKYIEKGMEMVRQNLSSTSVNVPITVNVDNKELGDRLRDRLDRDVRRATAEELARDREVAEQTHKDQYGHSSN